MQTNWMNHKEYKSRGEGGVVTNILWEEKSWRRLGKKRGDGAKMWLSVSLLWAATISKGSQLNPNQKWQKDEPKPTTFTPVSNYTHSSAVMLYLVSSLVIFTAVPLFRVLDMSECLGKWAERNPKPEHWVRGALTVSASCKSENTGRGWCCVHFPACLGFSNWHASSAVYRLWLAATVSRRQTGVTVKASTMRQVCITTV